jgi:hypothetical protein
MPDTGRMWILLRLVALLVLSLVLLLLTGHGAWLLGALEVVSPTGSAPGQRHGQTASVPVVAGGLGAGALAALVRPADRAVGQVVTLLHELGHTLVAAAFGARPAGIVLRHDASGHATARWVGRATVWRRLALAVVAFVGLPAATVTSATGARLLGVAGPDAVLWCFAAAGVVVAVLARSVWSLLVAAALTGLAVAALGEAAAPWARGVVVGALTAIALRATLDTARALRRPLHPGDDARVVGRHLRLPPRLVQLVQVATTMGLGIWSVLLLLPDELLPG